jgi:plastocyanin
LGRKHVVAVVAIVVAAVVAGAALAATRSGGPVVKTPGTSSFVINQYAKDAVHFAPGTIKVPSGGSITFMKSDKDPEPHTVTISTKADLPKSFAQRCKPCEIASHHLKDPNDDSKGAKTYILNKGQPGFDVEGDSVVLAPKGPHKSETVVVSAPPGTTLYFLCAIHPWMQGKIVVT